METSPEESSNKSEKAVESKDAVKFSKSDIKEFTNLERNLSLSHETLINHSALRKIYCRIWGI